MSAPRVLQVGVVVFPNALPMDPTCIFTALSTEYIIKNSVSTPYAFEITYLGESLDTVACTGNLNIAPSRTFADVQQGQLDLDVMLVPGGSGARPFNASEGLKGFVKWGADNVEWVLTVCTGSGLIAHVGGLDGQKATTNKIAFQQMKELNASRPVEWIAKARYVRSGKFWTASGVSAGADMACGFVREICGNEAEAWATRWSEYTAAGPGDDPWAEHCGLT